MAVTDTSVLWAVVGQVRAQSLDLPEGSPVTVTPPSEADVADRENVLAVHDDSGRIVYDGPFADPTLP